MASELVHLVHLRNRREAQLQRDGLLDSLQRSSASATGNLLSGLSNYGKVRLSELGAPLSGEFSPRFSFSIDESAVCFQQSKGNGATTGHHSGGKGWGTVPITLIAILALLCLLLIVHIVRGRFRARLSPSETSYSTYPPQYYKCVPAYDTPVHRNEKIVPL